MHVLFFPPLHPCPGTSLLLCIEKILHSLALANAIVVLEAQFKQEDERKEDLTDVSSMEASRNI